ncbi:MAG TPA: sigma-70 family RNA polymerase sigma factor [Actinomycetota bacterium]|nr:sigma-70 family RNA polymerase sigma factor [Actinomycetota bacterium]
MSDLDEVLEDCFRREWPVLVGAVARIVGDLHDAEEIVQDVLVSALARWPFSGVPDTPGAWLMTAARNRARNHLRDVSRASARLHAAAVLTRDAEAEEEAAAEPTNGPAPGRWPTTGSGSCSSAATPSCRSRHRPP